MPDDITTKTKTRRVAVIGTAPAHFHKGPVRDPDWETWGTSPGLAEALAAADLPRCDRWFELHRPGVYAEAWPDHYLPFLKAGGSPVYSFHPLQIENSVAYPREEIEERFGTAFLTSTIAWMLALAIHEGADVIGIWGVDMASDTEYAEQRTGCQHFMSLAQHHAGIDIHMPPESHLLVPTLTYPDNGEAPQVLRLETRRQEANQQLKAVREQIETLRAAENKLLGRIEEIEATARTLGMSGRH